MDFGGDRIAERPHQWLLEFITDIIASDFISTWYNLLVWEN
jgi:hypothetical protein